MTSWGLHEIEKMCSIKQLWIRKINKLLQSFALSHTQKSSALKKNHSNNLSLILAGHPFPYNMTKTLEYF